jgi:osmotically-inducible protein OsmY
MKIKKLSRVCLIGTVIFLLIGCSFAWSEETELDDEDINMAVFTEILFDEAVSPHLLNIHTSDGIVTLSGSVDNILDRDRVISIAQSIKGVRAVVDKMEVKAVQRSDRQLREDVKEALLKDPATDSYELGVQVIEGIVTLSGTVDSYAEWHLCSQVAKSVLGVKGIRNVIDVEYREERADHEIKADIEGRLNSDVRIDNALIDVEVKDGRVTLTGKVGSTKEKFLAEFDAWVSGVNSVQSDGLEIEWWARDRMQVKDVKDPSDVWIEEAIKDAFFYDPRVLSFELEVDVEDGIATLMGEVDNLRAKRAAQKDAENTVGVNWVRNYIRVLPGDLRSDLEIAEEVRTALKKDPYVNRFDVSVLVFNNKVHLYGSVDSHFQKYQAEHVASGIAGVVDVENNIKIEYSWEGKNDWQIKWDIESQLSWSPYFEDDEIEVEVTNGVAKLTGKVDTWFEYSEAAKEAMEGGAKEVINKLEVQ